MVFEHLVDESEAERFLWEHPTVLLHEFECRLDVEFACGVLGILVGDDEVDGIVALLLALEFVDELVEFFGCHVAPGVDIGRALVDEECAVVVDDHTVASIAEPCGSTGAEAYDMGGDIATFAEHVADGDGFHDVAAKRVYLQFDGFSILYLGEFVFEQITSVSPGVDFAVEFDDVHIIWV